jgi:hypothetical protein
VLFGVLLLLVEELVNGVDYVVLVVFASHDFFKVVVVIVGAVKSRGDNG